MRNASPIHDSRIWKLDMWWLLFEPFWHSWTASEGDISRRALSDAGPEKRIARHDERGQLIESDDAGPRTTDRKRRAKKTKRSDKVNRPHRKAARSAAKKTARKALGKTAARKGTARKSAARKSSSKARTRRR